MNEVKKNLLHILLISTIFNSNIPIKNFINQHFLRHLCDILIYCCHEFIDYFIVLYFEV